MFSSKSLLFVTLVSALFTAGSAVKVVNPTGLIQCQNTTLEWTGGKAPFTVEVYTTCDDDNDDAITTWTGVTGRSVEYYVNRVSGKGIFVRVIDADDDEDYSDDSWIGGKSGDDSDKCWKSITDNKLQTQSFEIKEAPKPSTSAKPSSTLAPSAGANTAEDSGPTTQAGGSSYAPNTGSGVNAAGVANAAQGPDSNKKANTGANIYQANGASSTKRFPAIEIAAGLVGAALASML